TTDPTTDPSDTDTDTDTTGEECVPCVPSQVAFSGMVPQAGVEVDDLTQACSAVGGMPMGDLLVLDFLGGQFVSGSGSGAVLALSHGTFENQDGFYLLDMLPFDTLINIVIERDGTKYEIQFRVESAGMSAVLKDVCVRFLS
ncbi:MAG: hypothetical protein KC636_22785, partial [Myxococcales bacterium]|nr:hypothetical protein [Myxococcales bacterium]